jgi:serine/threonine protein kinase
LYEILYQVSPFYSDDKNQLKENICSKDPVFLGKTSSALKDLIRKLLTKDPTERLEFIENIKSHRFFEGISFENLLSKQIPMPYIPEYIRGKKMVKVIREDVEAFTKLSD